jgi:catechol 2,3-dioxygenase-like lactoylglutathione lyase family enzyme
VQFDHVALQVPDVRTALDWWQQIVPGSSVLYVDDTWAMLDAAGLRIAFVTADQHPDHLAFKVPDAKLAGLADEHAAEILTHRDGSRSFYVDAPGEQRVELIAFPDAVDENAE